MYITDSIQILLNYHDITGPKSCFPESLQKKNEQPHNFWVNKFHLFYNERQVL